MAERRMFTKKVTDDDNFMSLSASAQALYLHLSMAADDDGFCNQVSISMFKAHASVQDLQALLERRYIYQFENGVIVIKHWRMANALRKDRYTPTAFQEELAKLEIKENGSYTWLPDGCQTVAACLPQDRIGKVRIEKVSVGKERGEEKKPDGLLDSLDVSEELKSTIKDFVKMRKLIKAPMTNRALKLMVDKLMEMGGNDETRIAILNQSIVNSWKGIFPLHDTQKAENTQTKAEREEHEYASMLNRWAGG